jgi:hypothetical protein
MLPYMNEYKPLRAVLFFYEVLRVLLLAGLFVFFSPLEGAAKGGVFPFLAYVTPNALFPLMALFLWMRPEEFPSYVPLYLAGKVIAVIAIYAWGALVFVPALALPLLGVEVGDVTAAIALLSGGFIISLGDALSILAGSVLKRKTKSPNPPAAEAGDNGGQL